MVGNTGSDIQQGVGLRVVQGDQTGFAFTEDLSLQAMLAAAESVVATAGTTTAMATPTLQFQQPGDLYEVAVPWGDVGVERKTAILQSIDEKARAADPAIEKVTINWHDVDEHVMIATLDGNVVTDYRPMTRLALVVTATRAGKTQTGFSSIAARAGIDWYSDERIAALVDEAVSRTLVQFDARRAPVGEMPVILAAGTSGVVLHEAVGHAFEADFIKDGTSPTRGLPVSAARSISMTRAHKRVVRRSSRTACSAHTCTIVPAPDSLALTRRVPAGVNHSGMRRCRA
jgi:TldD protein